MRSIRRSTGIIVLLLVLFFLFKVLRFQTLAYTFHDFYSFLQMATGWIDGRPFMYENFYGDHQRIHNYYTMWLLGPLCYQLGAYGLFLVQTLLLLVAYGLTNQRLATLSPRWVRYGLLAIVLLGPTAVWLNDHTNMGWHTELTYLPLGILFALALTGRGWFWPLAAGLALTLVKEDGAVLAATIHLGYLGIMYLNQNPGQPLWRLVATRRFWLVGLGWGLVFVAGMAWLAYLNRFAEPRLRVALGQIADNAGTVAFWRQTGRELGNTLLLLVPPGCLLALLVRQLRLNVGGRLWVLYGLGVFLLTVMNFVQSAVYYTNPVLYRIGALTWPPRFVLLWTFTAAFLTILLAVMPFECRPSLRVPVWLVMGGLIAIQLPIIRLVRPDLPGFREAKALALGRVSPFKESRYVDPSDLTKVGCFAEHIPTRSDVMASEYVLPYFHKHYIVWPDSAYHQPADLAVIYLDAKQTVRQQAAMTVRRPHRTIRLKNYLVYVAADYERFVLPCIP